MTASRLSIASGNNKIEWRKAALGKLNRSRMLLGSSRREIRIITVSRLSIASGNSKIEWRKAALGKPSDSPIQHQTGIR
jgi:hypothetical protein